MSSTTVPNPVPDPTPSSSTAETVTSSSSSAGAAATTSSPSAIPPSASFTFGAPSGTALTASPPTLPSPPPPPPPSSHQHTASSASTTTTAGAGRGASGGGGGGGGSGGSLTSPSSTAFSPRSPPTVAATSLTTTTSNILHPHLPAAPSSPAQTAQARAALVGTISNLLDTELQGRAGLLHSNAAALEKQERDVAKATENLRRENDKLIKVVKEGSKKVLETGNVQNWAEVLERDFLVLEDTLRQVRERSRGGCSDPNCSGCSCGSEGASWSGSASASGRSSRRASFGGAEDRGLDDAGDSGGGKGKSVDGGVKSGGMEVNGEPTSPGDRDGTFAPIRSAIEISISEAMASSMGDIAESSPIELSTDPLGQHIAEDQDEGKEVNGTDVDMGTAMDTNTPPESSAQVQETLAKEDMEALSAIGLGPVIPSDSQLGTSDELSSDPKDTANSTADYMQMKIPNRHPDEMEIDSTEESVDQIMQDSHVEGGAPKV